jgi:hypothetical protein
LDTEVAQADKAGIDVLTYDLSAFKTHGGKVLLYHGLADSTIPPGHTVLYYNSVLAKMGKKQDDWLRLYLEPGMAHCGGGPGPDQFNKMAVIERWREAGQAARLLRPKLAEVLCQSPPSDSSLRLAFDRLQTEIDRCCQEQKLAA